LVAFTDNLTDVLRRGKVTSDDHTQVATRSNIWQRTLINVITNVGNSFIPILKMLHLLIDMASCQCLAQSLMRFNAVCNIA